MAIRAQFQIWFVAKGLVVGLALQYLAIESDHRVKKDPRSDILKDVWLILGIEKDIRHARRNKAAEAVGAKNGACFCFLDANVELGTIRQSVGKESDMAHRGRFILTLWNTYRLLEDDTTLGDLNIEGRGIKIPVE